MTFDRDHERFLRQVLHDAADSIEPAGDGLQRIRERLAGHAQPGAHRIKAPHHPAQFTLAGATARLREGLGQMTEFLRPGIGRLLHGIRWLRPEPDSPATPYQWLRPALVITAAVAVAAVAGLAISELSQTISPVGSLTESGPAGPQGQGHSGRPGHGGSPKARPVPQSVGSAGLVNPRTPAYASCAPVKPARRSRSPRPSAPVTTQPSKTPSPTPTPTPTVTPSATPDPSGSPTSTPPATPGARSTGLPSNAPLGSTQPGNIQPGGATDAAASQLPSTPQPNLAPRPCPTHRASSGRRHGTSASASSSQSALGSADQSASSAYPADISPALMSAAPVADTGRDSTV